MTQINEQTHTYTFERTPLEEGSVLRKYFCLTKHHTHSRQTYILPSGFEPAIGTTEQPLTHVLGGVTTGIGKYETCGCILILVLVTTVLWYHVWGCAIEIYT